MNGTSDDSRSSLGYEEPNAYFRLTRNPHGIEPYTSVCKGHARGKRQDTFQLPNCRSTVCEASLFYELAERLNALTKMWFTAFFSDLGGLHK